MSSLLPGLRLAAAEILIPQPSTLPRLLPEPWGCWEDCCYCACLAVPGVPLLNPNQALSLVGRIAGQLQCPCGLGFMSPFCGSLGILAPPNRTPPCPSAQWLDYCLSVPCPPMLESDGLPKRFCEDGNKKKLISHLEHTQSPGSFFGVYSFSASRENLKAPRSRGWMTEGKHASERDSSGPWHFPGAVSSQMPCIRHLARSSEKEKGSDGLRETKPPHMQLFSYT